MIEERTQYNCIHDEISMSQYPCNVCPTERGVCGSGCNYWAQKPTPPKPKGIDILMMCGETHHIDTEQPSIESVKVNGEQIYPSTQKEQNGKNVSGISMAKFKKAIKCVPDWWGIDITEHGENYIINPAGSRMRDAIDPLLS